MRRERDKLKTEERFADTSAGLKYKSESRRRGNFVD
jgi:hypothetical protein